MESHRLSCFAVHYHNPNTAVQSVLQRTKAIMWIPEWSSCTDCVCSFSWNNGSALLCPLLLMPCRAVTWTNSPRAKHARKKEINQSRQIDVHHQMGSAHYWLNRQENKIQKKIKSRTQDTRSRSNKTQELNSEHSRLNTQDKMTSHRWN